MYIYVYVDRGSGTILQGCHDLFFTDICSLNCSYYYLYLAIFGPTNIGSYFYGSCQSVQMVRMHKYV